MDGLADGHDDVVAGDADRRGGGLLGRRAAVPAHPADQLGLGPQGRGAAVFVHFDVVGGVQGQDLAALRLGLVHLFGQGGHVLHPAAVDAGHMGGPQPQAGAGGVHGHIAAADHHHPFARQVGDPALADVPQHPHGADHALAVLAGDAQLFVVVGADGDVHRVVLGLQLVQAQVGAAHLGVHDRLDPGVQDVLDVLVQHVGGRR